MHDIFVMVRVCFLIYLPLFCFFVLIYNRISAIINPCKKTKKQISIYSIYT